MAQSERDRVMRRFREGQSDLLVATDVAARGLDIPAVSHVINFDVPIHADDYIHRIGRTGRAGLSGTAISIVAPSDQKAVAAIEKLTGQPIAWTEQPAAVADEETAAPRRRQERGGRGRGGGRRGERSASPRREERAAVEPVTRSEEQAAAAPRARREERAAAPRPRREERAAAPVTRLDEARRRPAPPRREQPVEDIESHLPAFLLRPIRVKA
jgi:superfamily II DNA/RNA helicase